MTINRFRAAAGVLIAFNSVGTILTWTAHLQKPGTSAASAIACGTAFTGPLVLAAVGVVALVLTYSARRWLARTGIVLLALFGAGFAIGEISELFQHNIGISADRWDVVIVGSVIGAIIGITVAVLAVQALLTPRRPERHDPILAASNVQTPPPAGTVHHPRSAPRPGTVRTSTALTVPAQEHFPVQPPRSAGIGHQQR